MNAKKNDFIKVFYVRTFWTPTFLEKKSSFFPKLGESCSKGLLKSCPCRANKINIRCLTHPSGVILRLKYLRGWGVWGKGSGGKGVLMVYKLFLIKIDI